MNKTKFHIKNIAEITGATLLSPLKDCYIDDFLIDSRMLGSSISTLFFAIKTNRNDGHNYIQSLFEKGVRNFVVTDNELLTDEIIAESNILLVENSISALQNIAIDYRKKLDYPIVGITGSNGKTIVKEWLYKLLLTQVDVARSPKSYNSQIGVALSVLSLPLKCDIAIVEAGISMQNEMASLEKMIKPTIGIITNVGQAHLHNFSDANQLIDEKIKLFADSKVIIYCSDYENIELKLKKQFGTKKLVSWNHNSLKNRLSEYGDLFRNAASIENISHCLTFIDYFNYQIPNLSNVLKEIVPVEMRLEIKDGINNCLIINDSYSLDIKSFQIAVGELVRQKRFASKTIIVSDFDEKEHPDATLYEQVADIVNNNLVNQTFLIGKNISAHKHLFCCESYCYIDTDDFLRRFNSALFINQAILLKGARCYSFEKISNLLQQKEHETVLEVNVDAIVNNLNIVKSALSEATKLLVMVKAFSYGCGSVEIASILQSHHVDYLAVAFVDEGVELRTAGITLPIVVMNPEATDIAVMQSYHLEPEVYSLMKLRQLCNHAKNLKGNKLDIHIKFDTGMHRLGFSQPQLEELVKILNESKDYVEVKSVFSHLACADMPDKDDFTRQQLSLFESMSEFVEKGIGYSPMKHILNSYGIARFADYQFDMVRLGIGLYGAEPQLNKLLNLQPALQLKGRVAQVRDIQKGESIGYGMTWTALRDSRIAILPIGYADGYKLSLSNKDVNVYINGNFCPLVGRICMDMCFADVTDLNVAEGDIVEFFGEHIPLEYLAKLADSIPYEIISTLSRRIKRVYYL